MNSIDNKFEIKRNNPKEVFAKIFKNYGIYIVILLLVLISGIVSPKTVDPKNLIEILKNTSVLGIICIGQTLLILTRGIDLSVGAHVVFINILVAGISLGDPKKTFITILIVLAIGALIGLFNGALAVKLKIEPLLGSLGVMTLLVGISFLYTKGFAKGNTPPFIRAMGIGKVFGFLPISVIIWIFLAIVFGFLLIRTIFGRYVHAIGSNPKAASIAGIKVDRNRLLIYAISGVLTAIAGLIWSGFLGTPTLTGGQYLPLDSVAAVIIGGTTFAGGKGRIIGSMIGAVIIVYLSNFLTIVGLGVEWKIIAQGLIILLLVFIYVGRKIYK
jgi:inositol transport system permease protein